MTGESDLVAQRRKKLDLWSASGGVRYPYSFPGRSMASDVRKEAESLKPSEAATSNPRRLAGRILLVREVGKNAFAPLRDQSGEIQIHLQADHMGEERFRSVLSILDGGDIVGVEGFPSKSRSGEPSLLAGSLVLLSKALSPPPEKWHGLKDAEVRLRQRYVDLFTSRQSFNTFLGRSVLTAELRGFLEGQGFVGVETPVLARVASGAAARPFTTHYNFLDEDYKLRISLELHLKRLLVGGFEKVYEIGKVFRNEDMDSDHSPEFTELELYWAYADYADIRKLVEGLLHHLAKKANEMAQTEESGKVLKSFTPPFVSVDFVEALEARSGIRDIMSLTPEELRSRAKGVGARIHDTTPAGTCLEKLFAHYVERELMEPTFVMDHPLSTTPLARRHRSKPGRVERHELFYRGMELSNAYSELNDPLDQEARFLSQVREAPTASKGSSTDDAEEESYAYDSDYVDALRYGMPPAGGLGIGLDRLWMILLQTPSIKDVILFPPMKLK